MRALEGGYSLLLVIAKCVAESAAAKCVPTADLGYARYAGFYNDTYDLNIWKGYLRKLTLPLCMISCPTDCFRLLAVSSEQVSAMQHLRWGNYGGRHHGNLLLPTRAMLKRR